MKKTIITFAVLAALIIGAGFGYKLLADKYANPPETQSENASDGADVAKNAAPDFKMTDTDGNELMLSSLHGKPIVLNFWTTWCGYCTREFPLFQELYEEYGDSVQFIMVNLTDNYREKKSDADSFIKKNGYTLPVYYDIYQQGASAYMVSSIPCTFIIDKDGNLAESHAGAIDKDTLLSLLKPLGV